MVSLLSVGQHVERAGAVPSAVLHHKPDLPASLDQYAEPGNVIIVTAQQRIRHPERLRQWRAKGAIVMAYVNLVGHHEPYDPIDESLVGGAFPEQWIYPGNLVSWPGTRLLNLEINSPVATYNGFTGQWGDYAVRWIRDKVIGDGQLFNGVLLDVWGDKVWNVNVGGPGTAWEQGVAKWTRQLRELVGPDIYLVGNTTQSRLTARYLNGRMWESFTTVPSGSWNQLDGPNDGLVQTFAWPEWHRPQLDILWRNEGSPSAATKKMLVDAAARVTVTGRDIAVGASDHVGGFPAPFGGGGGAAPVAPVVPPRSPSASPTPLPPGAVRPAPTLVSTMFGRSAAGWSLDRGPRSSMRTSRRGLQVVTARVARSRAMAWRKLSATGDVEVATRIRVSPRSVSVPGARAVLSVVAKGGARREVGVLRTKAGGTRWGTWVRRQDGRRVNVRVSKVRVRNTWVNVRLKTGWNARKADVIHVGSARALVAPIGRLSNRRPVRVGVGLGPVSGRSAAGSMVVRSIQVFAQ